MCIIFDIQLGCGFLRNEKTETFVWLFQAFLEAMEGVEPTNIITGQDLAMKAAIARHPCHGGSEV